LFCYIFIRNVVTHHSANLAQQCVPPMLCRQKYCQLANKMRQTAHKKYIIIRNRDNQTTRWYNLWACLTYLLLRRPITCHYTTLVNKTSQNLMHGTSKDFCWLHIFSQCQFSDDSKTLLTEHVDGSDGVRFNGLDWIVHVMRRWSRRRKVIYLIN